MVVAEVEVAEVREEPQEQMALIWDKTQVLEAVGIG